MNDPPSPLRRRRFLQFAAASPVAGVFGGAAAMLLRSASAQEPALEAGLPTTPTDALSVFDLGKL